jgi:hypothetical protein
MVEIVAFWVMIPYNFVGDYVAGHIPGSHPVLLPKDKETLFVYVYLFIFCL